MCHATTCSTCKKSSWSGCGQHLDSVFARIPVENRCFCGFKTDAEREAHMEAGKSNKHGPYPLGGGGGCVIM